MGDHDIHPPAGPDPLLDAIRALTDHLAATRAAWDRIEARALPLLERVALALERGGHSGPAPGADPESAGRRVAADVRAAIDEGRWDRAQAILDANAGPADGGDPAVAALGIELARARDRALADLTARVDAARQAGDADGALATRDELAALLPPDRLAAIDRELIGWLMKLVQRRLRSVPVGPDVAALATSIVARFGGTPEGASLRAALPTLRRSAGLCPRCAEPYLGVDDACPKCQEAAGVGPAPAPTLTFVIDDLDAAVGEGGPVDLNDTARW